MSKRSFLLKVLSKSGFKDVYWVAILCFYGLLGLGFFALIFYQLFRAALNLYKRSVSTPSAINVSAPASHLTQRIAIIMLCLVAVTVFLLFFNRTLEYRGYGFYFWLCAGLMFASDRALPTYRALKITL